jgi:outer membrane protein assembly factor BamB
MKRKIILLMCILLCTSSSTVMQACAHDNPRFTLPDKGCFMAHCDPCQSDDNFMPVPEKNVSVVWYHRELAGEQMGTLGLGFSGNTEIAACTFSGPSDNLIVYDYNGTRLWNSGDLLNGWAGSSGPMIDIYGRVIACDNKVVIMVDPLDYDQDGDILEWKTELPNGGIPFSPIITQDGTIIIATDRGPIYALNSTDGSLLAIKYLIPDQPVLTLLQLLGLNDSGYFSTINTPCTNGNRVYISTHYKDVTGWFALFFDARLYAIDVDAQNPNPDDRLKVAWFRGFGGPSGASPTLINDTIYFDGDRGQPSLMLSPHIYAVQDMGSSGKLKWKTAIPASIDANMASDPRGGLWVVDTFLGRLVRYSIDTGKVLDRVNINALVKESGWHTPTSVITISGNESRPILLVSATAINVLKSSSYVLAIDLTNNNALLWKVKISETSFVDLQISLGQYPILTQNGEPRIVFATTSGGVWALGET